MERCWDGAYTKGTVWDGRLVYKKAITINGFAGLDFQFRGTTPTKPWVTARMYLVNDRLYQLFTIMRKQLVDSGYADKCLSSFRLLK